MLLRVVLPGPLQEPNVQEVKPITKREVAALTEPGIQKTTDFLPAIFVKGSYNEHRNDVEKIVTYLPIAALSTCRL